VTDLSQSVGGGYATETSCGPARDPDDFGWAGKPARVFFYLSDTTFFLDYSKS